MDLDHLVRLLDRDGEAFAACRRAVAAGAIIRVWDGGTPASALAAIYTRRLRLVQRRDTPDVGFAEAVQALRACGEEFVRIGAVEMQHPAYHFQLFLNVSATVLIACLGVGSKLEDVGMRPSPDDDHGVRICR